MAYQYLVLKESNKIFDVVEDGNTFETHEDFIWVSGPDLEEGKTSADYEYTETDGITLKEEVAPAYDMERKFSYPPIADQLGQLWHDMNSGTIPGKETSEWFKSIAEVKEKYPKE
jgi:hypothetical protein